MNIFSGTYNTTSGLPKINLFIEKSGESLLFFNLFELIDNDEYVGDVRQIGDKSFGVASTLAFDFAEMRNHAQWGDAASWHLYVTGGGLLYVENIHAETFSSKANGGAYATSKSKMPVAILFVPYADSSIQDAGVMLQIDADSIVGTSPDLSIVEFDGKGADFRSGLMPSMTLTSADLIQKNAELEFAVTVMRGGSVDESCSSEICIESTGGYLPLQRAQAVRGVASFNLKALDVPSGSKIKVKVGFRNFSSMASKTITVI